MTMTHTYTRTSTFAIAPCGHSLRVPNEAYDLEGINVECGHIGCGSKYTLRIEESPPNYIPTCVWDEPMKGCVRDCRADHGAGLHKSGCVT